MLFSQTLLELEAPKSIRILDDKVDALLTQEKLCQDQDNRTHHDLHNQDYVL